MPVKDPENQKTTDGLIKVIIADDHQLFRDGIISILGKHEGIDVVGEASNGTELLEILKGTSAHVVLIDISMPDTNGLDFIRDVRATFPNHKFVVLTMHADGQYVVKAVKSGAYGYLLKNTDHQELIQAIKQVAQGTKYFNRKISELMIGNMAVEEDIKQLSKRELEVLSLVSDGKTTKEIADALFVSTRTVETHRMNMMKKLGVHNTAELIKKAALLKLL